MLRSPRAGLLALALFVMPAGLFAQDPADRLTAGRAAFEAEDFESARRELMTYLDETRDVSGASRLPRAEAIHLLAVMETDPDAAIQYYETVVDQYPASTVADQALFRLGVLALIEGFTPRARERFRRLEQDYPFSRMQPELAIWTGRTLLAEGRYGEAQDEFLAGFARVKSQDLPFEVPAARRSALEAEYAYWLATAHRESGDRRGATQYYSLLVLDYPSSPQAADARRALDEIDQSVGPVSSARVPSAAEERGQAPPPAEAPADRTAPDDAAAEPPSVVVVPGEPLPGEPQPGAEDAAPNDAQGPPAEVVAEAPSDAAVRPPPAISSAAAPPADLAEPPAKFPPPPLVFLQVGAFSSASRAAALSTRLKGQGFDTRVETTIVDGAGYYRVQVGPYRRPAQDTRIAADRARLEASGLPVEEVTPEP